VTVSSAHAASCPEGYVEIRREVTAENKLRLYCQPIDSPDLNAEVARIVRGIRKIQVPPPIPPEDAAIAFGELAPNDVTSKRVLEGLEQGIAVVSLKGTLGGVLLPGKLILATGKTFIAAENAADLYLVSQNDIYEQALRYLKDENTRMKFTGIIRSMKEGKPVGEDASIGMVRAAQAILDPKRGNSGTRIAWDAMFSREACRAAVTQASIEMGGMIMGEAVGMAANRVLAAQQPAFREATDFLTHARVVLGKTKDPKTVDAVMAAVRQANEMIGSTFVTTAPPAHLIGETSGLFFKAAIEEHVEKKREK
jgi:hypothetical protein